MPVSVCDRAARRSLGWIGSVMPGRPGSAEDGGDPVASSATAASNAARAPSGTGSGTDQWSQAASGSSSSWARSHTVTTSVRDQSTSSRSVGPRLDEVEAGPPGGGDGAGVDPVRGWVPAEPPALRVACSPQRGGQLAAGRVVGADEQRPARRGPGGREQAVERVADAGARSGAARRRSSATARSGRRRSSTSRWWASRFDSRPNSWRSSTGARSERASSSTMARRTGSPRAAWRAARTSSGGPGRMRRSDHSTSIESNGGD